MTDARAIVVMGVSGCGKTSVAEGLAASLGAAFIEGDSLHPAANVEKMSRGIPLTDEDRWPWLDMIGRALADARAAGNGVVVSCSALRKVYRERLRNAAGGTLSFVFLKGSRDLLMTRMAAREGHFLGCQTLGCQTLERWGPHPPHTACPKIPSHELPRTSPSGTRRPGPPLRRPVAAVWPRSPRPPP